jgi:tetratricopeptide (TPR) repeat protein
MAEVTLEEAPRKAREQYEKGLSAMERGNLDYAMDSLMAALDLSPRFLRARKFLRAAAIKKLKSGSVNAFTHTLALISGLGGVLKTQSQIKKKPEQALKEAEMLMRKDPLNRTFIALVDQAAVAADMPEVAIMTLEVAREHYPNDVKLMQRLGKLYLDSNRMHDARMLYEDLVRLRPNDTNAIKSLKDATALDSMQKGGWSEAGSYRDVMKDTKEATRLEQESKAVKSGKDVDEMIEETLHKIQREPENINYRRALAELYSKAERFDEALQTLQETQKGAGSGDPQIERAISTLQVRKLDHAIAAAEAAGDKAGAEAKLKEKTEFLLVDAEDRVRRYPNDLQFRYDLGVLLYEKGQLVEAIQQFQMSQRNPQRRIRSLYYMALCFKQKQQYDIAGEQLEKAASELHLMDDTKKDILYELGLINELLGRPEKAVEYYKEIYAVDIGFRDISQKIEKSYKQ